MTNRPETIRFYRKRLPHWEVVGGLYFITLRLRDSLPRKVEEDLKTLLLKFKNADERNKVALQRQIFRAMESFKSWTATQALPLLGGQVRGFWQREWFDHWSRSGMEDERIVSYIRNNPVKAGLVKHYADWPYGHWATPTASE